MSGEGLVPTTSAPAAAAIEQDTPCRKCGYNLRGLSVEGRCPECGTSVGFSLQGDLLRYCDPNWMDALRRGVKCIIAAVVLGIFGVVAGIALGVGAGNAGIGFAVEGGAVVVAMIVAAVGWWMLTQPDPRGLGEDQYGTPRKIIRVAQVVGLAHVALVGLTATITVDDATLLALQAVSVVAIVVSVVGIFAECSYLERIARRIPDEKLSSRRISSCGHWAFLMPARS
jgi:hypothetical protein